MSSPLSWRSPSLTDPAPWKHLFPAQPNPLPGMSRRNTPGPACERAGGLHRPGSHDTPAAEPALCAGGPAPVARPPARDWVAGWPVRARPRARRAEPSWLSTRGSCQPGVMQTQAAVARCPGSGARGRHGAAECGRRRLALVYSDRAVPAGGVTGGELELLRPGSALGTVLSLAPSLARAFCDGAPTIPPV